MPQRINIANQLIDEKYDNGSVSYPNDTTEVYTFKNGNATVATLTLVYVDNTKEQLSTWSKS